MGTGRPQPDTITRIGNIRSDYAVLSKDDEQVAAIRQQILEGDATPIIVQQLNSGAFQLHEASNARYLAHIYEDFEHVPVLIAPKNN